MNLIDFGTALCPVSAAVLAFVCGSMGCQKPRTAEPSPQTMKEIVTESDVAGITDREAVVIAAVLRWQMTNELANSAIGPPDFALTVGYAGLPDRVRTHLSNVPARFGSLHDKVWVDTSTRGMLCSVMAVQLVSDHLAYARGVVAKGLAGAVSGLYRITNGPSGWDIASFRTNPPIATNLPITIPSSQSGQKLKWRALDTAILDSNDVQIVRVVYAYQISQALDSPVGGKASFSLSLGYIGGKDPPSEVIRSLSAQYQFVRAAKAESSVRASSSEDIWLSVDRVAEIDQAHRRVQGTVYSRGLPKWQTYSLVQTGDTWRVSDCTTVFEQ